jgi:hypothetical protein
VAAPRSSQKNLFAVYGICVPLWNYCTIKNRPLIDKEFQRRKLVGASQRFPTKDYDAYYRSLLGVSGRVVYERTNIDNAQLHISDFSAFQGKPIAVVTGTADIDHPKALDAEIVDWLKANGAGAQHIYLGDLGLEGNGHMVMLEENSDEVASQLIQWIRDGH